MKWIKRIFLLVLILLIVAFLSFFAYWEFLGYRIDNGYYPYIPQKLECDYD